MKCKAKKGFFFVRECGVETSVKCSGCGIPVCKKHLNGYACKECSRNDSYDPYQDEHHHDNDYNRQDEDEFAAAAAASEIISTDSDDADFFDS